MWSGTNGVDELRSLLTKRFTDIVDLARLHVKKQHVVAKLTQF